MSTMTNTSSLQHKITLAGDLRAGDHVWSHGEVKSIVPRSKRVMHVTFTDGETLAYDPRERVLCDEG